MFIPKLKMINSMEKQFQKYFTAVKYLESINNIPQNDYFVKKTGRSLFLKRFTYFLNLIGNPQNDLKFIHISGTSGKGSIAYMIEAILTESGLNTGLYTSPHCTTTIERIKAGGLFINPNEFADMVDKLKPKINYAALHSPFGRPSYFEIITAMAFLYFKKKKCAYVVLEVGLGGSFDATNVIRQAEITIINLIDYDHVNILGKKLTAIAKEKSAIIKPGTTVFTTAKNKKSVINIFRQASQEQKVKLHIIKPPQTKYHLPLVGDHQQANAELASRVCQKLGIPKNKIIAGLKKVKLPCRFEIIQKNPTVILDGAHNFSKINSTVAALKNLTHSTRFALAPARRASLGSTLSGTEGLTYKKLYLIIALTKERNPKKVFKNLIPLADKIFITSFKLEPKRKYPPQKLARDLLTKKQMKIFTNSKKALTAALKDANNNDIVLVTGSLYLAGEIRNQFIKEEIILNKRKI